MGLDNAYGIGSLKPGVCTSTSRPGSPFAGQVIYETDTKSLVVYDGAQWSSLNPVDRDRNVIINGAMQISQRATSKTSITSSGYYTADRWNLTLGSLGTWTQSVETDGPTGSGFRRSLKMLCTTADASPAAGDTLLVRQHIEGQNIQHFAKGTSSARPITVSFWVKANVTGTYIVELEDSDNSRAISASYTVSASATWEKKTVTFVADTTGGTINNDSERSLDLNFWLGAGSNFTGGSSLATSWATPGNTRVVGQTNLGAATNNYWQVTGVQLEAGSVPSAFEFESYSTTLSKCQRYYCEHKAAFLSVKAYSTIDGNFISSPVMYPVPMRGTPTVNPYDLNGTVNQAHIQFNGSAGGTNTSVTKVEVTNLLFHVNKSSGIGNDKVGTIIFKYDASAEL